MSTYELHTYTHIQRRKKKKYFFFRSTEINYTTKFTYLRQKKTQQQPEMTNKCVSIIHPYVCVCV
jgi:preprotein translocase subunit SecB